MSDALRYFAYGSNLDPEQMTQRCPSARFLCRAYLPGYRLAFTRYSKIRRCGVVDLTLAPDDGVWGVVYTVAVGEVTLILDQLEGYDPARPREDNGYVRGPVTVRVDGDRQTPMTVETYTVAIKGGPYRPSADYKGHMVKGATAWSLPAPWIARLEALPERRGRGD